MREENNGKDPWIETDFNEEEFDEIIKMQKEYEEGKDDQVNDRKIRKGIRTKADIILELFN